MLCVAITKEDGKCANFLIPPVVSAMQVTVTCLKHNHCSPCPGRQSGNSVLQPSKHAVLIVAHHAIPDLSSLESFFYVLSLFL